MPLAGAAAAVPATLFFTEGLPLMMRNQANEPVPELAALPAFADAAAAIRALGQVAVVQAGMLAVLLLPAAFLIAARPGRSPNLDAMVHAGAGGLIGGALTVSLTGTLCCLLLAWGRRRSLRAAPTAAPPVAPLRIARWRRGRRAALSPVTRLAGWPQAVLMLAGSAAAAGLVQHFGPVAGDIAGPVGWPGIAGLLLLPTFLVMVCERVVAAVPSERLPEGGRLAALLRLPVLVLLALAGLAATRGFGLAAGFVQSVWPARILAVLVLAVAAELAVRTLAVWFLPLPAPERARAAIGSVVAGLLQPGALHPAGMAQRLRTQRGIDISRSWAVGYTLRAAPPVLLFLLALSWGLSGVTSIGLSERGSYERFGAPVAMLRPGLHVLLPWPFGRVRRVEYGVVHAVPVGTEAAGPTPAGTPAAIDTATADGDPPTSANRLWDSQPGVDIPYLIASRSGDRQSFETVSVDVRVLYRVGLSDQAARDALYGSVDPDLLVRSLSGRLLARFFADRTLPQVLGERRERVAGELRADLQAQLDQRHSGLEVVALIVESMHPPGGAASAYRSVQAAQIVASTREAEEAGRAHGTFSVAARDAHEVQDQAQGLAAELVGAAQVDRAQADADALAFRSGGRAFLLERYFSNLRQALPRSGLEIVDHRLQHQDMPMIDLRGAASGAMAGDGR
ncbi:MAG: SPFH domain-containing protein [Acetobacteraceae bacterium]|nr:SPFH domain-containing protein [Acetobacteraceae bacterium]